MPAIGCVSKQSNGGFKGQLETLSIRAGIDIVPNTAKTTDNQPDFSGIDFPRRSIASVMPPTVIVQPCP